MQSSWEAERELSKLARYMCEGPRVRGLGRACLEAEVQQFHWEKVQWEGQG